MAEEIVLQGRFIDLDVNYLQETLCTVEGKDWQQGFSHVEFGLK